MESEYFPHRRVLHIIIISAKNFYDDSPYIMAATTDLLQATSWLPPVICHGAMTTKNDAITGKHRQITGPQTHAPL
jgi:hypothetical protein